MSLHWVRWPMDYGRCARSRNSKPSAGIYSKLQLRQSGFLLVNGAQPTPAEAEDSATFEPADAGRALAEAEPRFRIFIIDSGWNTVAPRVLRHNFALIRRLRRENLIYLVSRKKSAEFIRRHQSLIGRDPIIAVHDLEAIPA
jgi:hypothetical protein